MSGDWIKMRGNLWDDPRIARICDLTDSTEGPVIGALYWLWAAADQHTEDGIMPGLTLRQIDRKTGLEGFGEALCQVGWLADHPEGVRLVKFEEHNGESAKKRCQTAKRVAKFKSANAEVTQPALPDRHAIVSGALPREEKRREEEEIAPSELAVSSKFDDPPPPPPPFDGKNAKALNGKCVVLLSAVWELPDDWGLDAEALGWQPREVLHEAEKFRQYWTAGKGMSSRRGVKGWRQTWSNWLGKAAERKLR